MQNRGRLFSFVIRHSEIRHYSMSGPAQVRSTPVIETLAIALARFEKRVQAALDTLDGEMHRTEDWLEHDRPGHWKRELHEAEDMLHETKMDLERCLMMVVAGQRPACREQKAAVAEAQARLAYCREKGEVVKQWQRNFRHESLEYRGRVGQLRRALEHDVPKARALLMKIVRRLEEYHIERPPEAMDLPDEPLQTSNESATRSIEQVTAPKPDGAEESPG
jgi:exonuclease VII large subunit